MAVGGASSAFELPLHARDSTPARVFEGWRNGDFRGQFKPPVAENWEKIPVKPTFWNEKDAKAPTEGDTSRPVTAPSGAFEFDLQKGEWHGTPGKGTFADYYYLTSPTAGRTNDEKSVAVSEMKKVIETKDAHIARLEAELLRVRGGDGNVSVISELTAPDV